MEGPVVLGGGNKKTLENIEFKDGLGKKNPAMNFQFPPDFLPFKKPDKQKGKPGKGSFQDRDQVKDNPVPFGTELCRDDPFHFFSQFRRLRIPQDFPDTAAEQKIFQGLIKEGDKSRGFDKPMKEEGHSLNGGRIPIPLIPRYETGKGAGENFFSVKGHGGFDLFPNIFPAKPLFDNFRGNKLPFDHGPNARREFMPPPGKYPRGKGKAYPKKPRFPKGAEEHLDSDGIGNIPNNGPHQGGEEPNKERVHGTMDSAAV
jgi:hypothetical protein